MWTKRDIIAKAHMKLGIASHESDLSPEDLSSGLMDLDALISEWAAAGVRFGATGGDGFGTLDETANVPPYAASALYMELAIRLAPEFGKAASMELKASAKAAKDALSGVALLLIPKVATGYGGGGVNLGQQEAPLFIRNTGPLEFGE